MIKSTEKQYYFLSDIFKAMDGDLKIERYANYCSSGSSLAYQILDEIGMFTSDLYDFLDLRLDHNKKHFLLKIAKEFNVNYKLSQKESVSTKILLEVLKLNLNDTESKEFFDILVKKSDLYKIDANDINTSLYFYIYAYICDINLDENNYFHSEIIKNITSNLYLKKKEFLINKINKLKSKIIAPTSKRNEKFQNLEIALNKIMLSKLVDKQAFATTTKNKSVL